MQKINAYIVNSILSTLHRGCDPSSFMCFYGLTEVCWPFKSKKNVIKWIVFLLIHCPVEEMED